MVGQNIRNLQGKPELGHQSMHIGIADFEGKQCINYLSLLSEPFKTKEKVNL